MKLKSIIMIKTFTLLIAIIFSITIANAQSCQADFSYFYYNGGWPLDINDASTVIAPDYIVSWSWEVDGSFYASTQNITLNNGGSHYVCLTIVTNNGCTSNSCDNVTDTSCQTFHGNYYIDDETLLGNDGSITGIAYGGTSPYSFTWSTGATSYEYADTIFNLTAGTYHVTVIDGNGCEDIDTIDVLLNTNCYLDITPDIYIPEQCGNDGFITLNEVGALGLTTYIWSSGQTTQNIYGLSEGTYSVTVEDAVGCMDSLTIDIIHQINLSGQLTTCLILFDSAFVYNDSLTTLGHADLTWVCYKNSGTAYYLVVDYHYDCLDCFIPEVKFKCLSNGLVQVFFSPDTICIDTLATNCYLDITPDIYMPEQCGNDGYITLNEVGATGLTTYIWSSGQTTQNIYGLSEGTYSVTVEDAAGCMDSLTIDIIHQINLSEELETCLILFDSAFVYNDSLTTPGHADLTWVCYKNSGTAYYLVVDYHYDCLDCFIPEVKFNCLSNGLEQIFLSPDTICIDTLAAKINEVKDISVSIYPNPTNGKITIQSEGIEKIELIDLQGRIFYVSEEKCNISDIDFGEKSKGIYFVKIQTSKGIITKKIVLK